MQAIATQNASHGFYAAISNLRTPSLAWNVAIERIMRATDCEDYEARAFLDSTFGTRFANDVARSLTPNGTVRAAVDAAISRWMTRRLQDAERRSLGIMEVMPGGPFLEAAVYTASCFEMADA